MRRAAAMAVVLIMALSGVALAKEPVAKVTGTYTYRLGSSPRTVTLVAHATNPATGTFEHRILSTGEYFRGVVTCLMIDGSDAWIAGPITQANSSTPPAAAFLRVHDGGTPGAKGDWAVTWGGPLEDMLQFCSSMSKQYDSYQSNVVSGNLVVHAAR